ncbi:hypothetical protein C0995_010645 [Termitomyces sp. Mi166|nr:hypothetical protein C0995_010645 [Termitomyces sp. Mi166\
MLLNYWTSSDDEGGNGLEELRFDIDATTGLPPASGSLNSGFSDVYHMLPRSESAETIRHPTRRTSPPPLPRQRHAKLFPDPDPVFTTPRHGPSSSKPTKKNSKPKNNNANLDMPTASWTFLSHPKWAMEEEMMKLSDTIHDGCSDLNPAFDYRYISKEDIAGHLTYERIKLELLLSASQMAREDLEHARCTPSEARGLYSSSATDSEARAPLLIRHVRSLRNLPCLHAYGDKKELCVAFLTMLARKRGIGTLSVDKLGQNQTEVYRQIANQLEADMRKEYDQTYNDAKRKTSRVC